jgi:hypothetical protein
MNNQDHIPLHNSPPPNEQPQCQNGNLVRPVQINYDNLRVSMIRRKPQPETIDDLDPTNETSTNHPTTATGRSRWTRMKYLMSAQWRQFVRRPKDSEEHIILASQSGAFKPGKLTAILGTSSTKSQSPSITYSASFSMC